MLMAPAGDGDGAGSGGGGGGSFGGGNSAVGSSVSSVDNGSLLSQPSASGSGSVPPSQTPTAPLPQINIPENWKEALPEEFRNDPAMKPITDLQSMAKSYLHAQKMIGKDKAVIPGKHATEDDWKMFWQQVGHPSNIQDYKLELPNDAGFDEGFITQLREQAFNIGILPNQMNKFLNWYSSANKTAVQKMNEEYKAKVAEGVSNLQKEWGQAFNERLELAKRAGKHVQEKLGIPNINTWLDSTGMGDDPHMIKILAFLGGFLKEDSIHGAEFSPQAQTPNQLDQEIKSIMGDPKHPYFDKTHPGHKNAVDQVKKLYSQLYPEMTDKRVV